MVQARANNLNSDHYLFSPIDFSSEIFQCVNISFTTCANQVDLLPANQTLFGKAVLTIILSDIATSDVYYWQTEMFGTLRSNVSFDISTDEHMINNANEYYYMSEEAVIDSCTWDFMSNNENIASDAEYNEFKERDYTLQLRSGTPTHNPYYDLGIPDSTFKTATDSWRWLAVGKDSYGNYLPIRYYAYSYQKYGNPNIMTHIMIIGHVWQKDNEYTTFTGEDNATYAKASAMLKIELFAEPQTVVYYSDTNTFGLMLGGESLTQIEEPAVEIKKSSSNIPHVVVGRYEYSNATKKRNFLGLGALVLKEVAVGVLDIPSYGFASVLMDIGELIVDASMSVGSSDGTSPVESYYSNASTQVQRYGHAIGGVKSTVRGYLRSADQHLGVRVWFATPVANASSVTSITWVYFVSPSMR